MRELRRTFNTINDDITKSKKVGELTYDSKNIDILIKTEDGHDSLYNKFLESSLDRNVIGNPYTIFGVSINNKESDSYHSVEYTDNCMDFEPIELTNDTCDYNSWNIKLLRRMFGMRPCIVKDGTFITYLSDNDYSITVEGRDASTVEGDRMIEFRKVWFKWINSGNYTKFTVANYEVNDTYNEICPEDFFYLSIYRLDSDGKSIVGNPGLFSYDQVTDKDIDQNIYHYLLGLNILLFKNLSVMDNIGNNYSTQNGVLDKKGLFYRGIEGNKIFGLENFWASSTFMNGISYDGNNYELTLNREDEEYTITNIIVNDWLYSIGCEYNYIYPLEYVGTSNVRFKSHIKVNNSNQFKSVTFGGLDTDPLTNGYTLSFNINDNAYRRSILYTINRDEYIGGRI